ncbi:hypothetical protein [Nitritalea halalkaliphila]|uniref:hypothetical protein n=1 Tax=Nitritalea halalkaliphila TaxID=590849 RepID=UPI0012EAC48B|nr:hypothetical protein [Nitritalea halalkaliphila]
MFCFHKATTCSAFGQNPGTDTPISGMNSCGKVRMVSNSMGVYTHNLIDKIG